jgi:uncharacterized protein YqiB (DUF1249 family)
MTSQQEQQVQEVQVHLVVLEETVYTLTVQEIITYKAITDAEIQEPHQHVLLAANSTC